MTHIANRTKKHLNVRHSRGEGTWPLTEPCPDEATFHQFNEIAIANRAAGLPVLSIRETLPQRFAQSPALKLPQARPYTLREWVGTADDPGPYWAFAAIMLGKALPGKTRRRFIVNLLAWLGEDVLDLPMTEVTRHHTQRAYMRLLVCKACTLKAKAEGRDDLLDCPEENLSAANAPWSGCCENDEEERTHHPDFRNTTIDDKLRSASLLFRVAQYAGAAPEPLDERCSPTQHDPFSLIARRQYTPKPGRLEHAFALTHGEVWVLDDLIWEAFRSATPLATYCMLRRGELCGLSIGDLDLPLDGGPGTLYIRNTLTPDGLVARGKTDGSVGTRVAIPAEVVRALQAYIRSYRSTPAPESCAACSDGLTHHNDDRKANPHRGCDFASSAPLYVDPRDGRRLNREDFSLYFGRAVTAAGLDRGKFVPTPHTLRATGATYLLQDGRSESEVMKQGRWANLKVVLDHYYRPLDGPQREHAERMDGYIRAANGRGDEIDESSLTETERLRLQLEQALAENTALKAAGHAMTPLGRRPRKPAFDEDDLMAELPLSRNETDLCERLGTTGGRNTRNRVRRMIQEQGLVPPWTKGRAA